MTDVDQLLAEFIAEDRAGGVADPSASSVTAVRSA
jgi:hypothetical protein